MSKTIFWHTAPWCTPCKQLKPMAKRVAEQAGATFIEVDVDVQQPVLSSILSVPTAVIYAEGESEPCAILTANYLTPAALRKALA